MYVPRTSLTICFFVRDGSSPSAGTCSTRSAAFTILFVQRTRKTPSAYIYTSFISDLVLAKLNAVGKHLGKLLREWPGSEASHRQWFFLHKRGVLGLYVRERIVLPTGSVSETRVGYRVGQGFHFWLFQKQCGVGL